MITYLWQDQTCETCSKRVEKECRAVPPSDVGYPEVKAEDFIRSACALWEPRGEEE